MTQAVSCDSSCDLNCDSICILWFHFTDFFCFSRNYGDDCGFAAFATTLATCIVSWTNYASCNAFKSKVSKWYLYMTIDFFLSVPVTNPLPIIKHYCSTPFLFLCFELHSMALTIGRTRSTKIYILWYLVICRLRNPMHKYINM